METPEFNGRSTIADLFHSLTSIPPAPIPSLAEIRRTDIETFGVPIPRAPAARRAGVFPDFAQTTDAIEAARIRLGIPEVEIRPAGLIVPAAPSPAILRASLTLYDGAGNPINLGEVGVTYTCPPADPSPRPPMPVEEIRALMEELTPSRIYSFFNPPDTYFRPAMFDVEPNCSADPFGLTCVDLFNVMEPSRWTWEERLAAALEPELRGALRGLAVRVRSIAIDLATERFEDRPIADVIMEIFDFKMAQARRLADDLPRHFHLVKGLDPYDQIRVLVEAVAFVAIFSPLRFDMAAWVASYKIQLDFDREIVDDDLPYLPGVGYFIHPDDRETALERLKRPELHHPAAMKIFDAEQNVPVKISPFAMRIAR